MMKRHLAPALAIMIIMAAPPLARAHAFLDTAVPKVGSVVTVPPKTISIQFTQPIEPAFSHIHLFTSDGKAVDLGPAAADKSDQTHLVAPVAGTLSPGKYIVRWDVLSVDTHRTNGHFPFTYQP